MEVSYVNLKQMKRQWLKENTSNSDVNEPAMMDFARRVSATIDVETQMEFMPRIDTRYYEVSAKVWNGDIDNVLRTLYLGEPMVSLTAVTLADATSLTVDTDVRLFPKGGQSPSVELQLSLATPNVWTAQASTGFDDIEVTGIWGWRDRYLTDGWQDSGDSVQDASGINASVTEITVTDANGANYFSDIPRFDPGMLIRIDSEFIAVTDTDTTTNKLTVIRGVRGSTAATHANDAQIDVFFPQPDIVRAAQLVAFYNYARRGRIDRITFDGLQTTEVIEIPVEAQTILDRYAPRGL